MQTYQTLYSNLEWSFSSKCKEIHPLLSVNNALHFLKAPLKRTSLDIIHTMNFHIQTKANLWSTLRYNTLCQISRNIETQINTQNPDELFLKDIFLTFCFILETHTRINEIQNVYQIVYKESNPTPKSLESDTMKNLHDMCDQQLMFFEIRYNFKINYEEMLHLISKLYEILPKNSTPFKQTEISICDDIKPIPILDLAKPPHYKIITTYEQAYNTVKKNQNIINDILNQMKTASEQLNEFSESFINFLQKDALKGNLKEKRTTITDFTNRLKYFNSFLPDISNSSIYQKYYSYNTYLRSINEIYNKEQGYNQGMIASRNDITQIASYLEETFIRCVKYYFSHQLTKKNIQQFI